MEQLYFKILGRIPVLAIGVLFIIPVYGFEMQGTISITQSKAGQSATTDTWFDAVIVGNSNRIRIGSIGDPAVTYFESGTISNGSYVLTMFDTNRTVTEYAQVVNGNVTMIKSPVPIKPINEATLVLNNDSIPSREPSALTAVWLSCVSGDRFYSEGIISPASLPLIFQRETLNTKSNISAATVYSINSGQFHFLNSLVQSVNPQQIDTANLLPLFRGAFTNSTYQVLAWTNIEGCLFPQKFVAAAFLGSIKLFESTGVVTNIIINAQPSIALEVPRFTRVVERRFGDTPPFPNEFGYTTTNGNLWTKEKLLEHSNVFRNISHNGMKTPEPPNFIGRLTFIRTSILIFFFVPIALIYRHLKKR